MSARILSAKPRGEENVRENTFCQAEGRRKCPRQSPSSRGAKRMSARILSAKPRGEENIRENTFCQAEGRRECPRQSPSSRGEKEYPREYFLPSRGEKEYPRQSPSSRGAKRMSARILSAKPRGERISATISVKPRGEENVRENTFCQAEGRRECPRKLLSTKEPRGERRESHNHATSHTATRINSINSINAVCKSARDPQTES
ncbi:hypothetical protein J0A71_03g05020 [Encephalitozoon cuniculi]|nr:hypothetical protein J0A71_02g04980 [Encephalitozoon cuniculi]UYI26669.1 hypothetical protein J0A71_03g05020 [Encephalitozoon cuniculi]